MSYLYVLASEKRIQYVTRKAQCAFRTADDLQIVALSESNRLNHLLSLIQSRSHYIDRSCFVVDGRDQQAVADFNAFVYALRMDERLNDEYPVVIRSINVI